MTPKADAVRFLKFGLIGLSSTGLYFVLLAVFRPIISNVFFLTALCYALSMIYNYLLQGRITFQSPHITQRSIFRYILMHLGAMIFNSAAMGFLVTGMGTPLYPTQICVTVLVAIFTYSVSKHWVFKP